jgi:hypothetical protein
MSRPASLLSLSEPTRVTEDPFWVIQMIGAVPFAVLLIAGLSGVRFAMAGASPFERSIEIDVLYVAGFSRLLSWGASVLLAILLCLSKTHATTTAKRWTWNTQVALVAVLLSVAHLHTSAVLALPR